MFKQTSYEFESPPKEVIKIIETIPSNWLSISADLHTSAELFKKSEILSGIIYKIGPVSGKNPSDLDYGKIQCSLDLCPNYLSCFGSCRSLHKKRGTIREVLTSLKKPCGITLSNVGYLNTPDLEETKSLVIDFLNQGYELRSLEAISGYTYSAGKGYGRPNVFAPEKLGLYVGEEESGGILTLGYFEEFGGKKENIDRIKDELENLLTSNLQQLPNI